MPGRPETSDGRSRCESQKLLSAWPNTSIVQPLRLQKSICAARGTPWHTSKLQSDWRGEIRRALQTH
jgi:hypothetical protein